MKDEHIIDLLERAPFAELSTAELATIKAHAEACAACLRAYEAARVSTLLLKERSAETFAPPPFFETRVLAALRERQATTDAWSFARLWQTTAALVSTMAALVALLAS